MKHLLTLLLCLFPAVSFAQTSPGFTAGQTLPAASLNAAFAAKQDYATNAANTVRGNATASPAYPTAIAVPSCSGASNALIWTSGTGFGCNTISGGGGINALTGDVTASGSGSVAARVGAIQGTTVTGTTGTGAAVLATAPTFAGTVTGPDASTWGASGFSNVNTTGAYQIGGINAVRQGTAANNAWTAIGPLAGDTLAASYGSTGNFDFYAGASAGQYATTAAESTGVGNNALNMETTGGGPLGHNTSVGQHSCGAFQVDSYRVCIGADAGRNSMNGANDILIGALSGRNLSLPNSIAIGTNAMFGAETTITLALTGGSPTAGDVIRLVFSGSPTSPYTFPGAPVTVNYTVVGGDTTLSLLTAHVAAAVNAANIAGAPTSITALLDTTGAGQSLMPGVIVIDAAGTTALGQQVTVTPSIQTGTGETVTASNQSGSGLNIGIGPYALYGLQATTASNNLAIGNEDGASLTTGYENVFFGNLTAPLATTTQQSVCGGYGACGALTTGSNIAAIGYTACAADTTGSCTAVGSGAGAAYVNANSGAGPTAIGLSAAAVDASGLVTAVGRNAGKTATGSSVTFVGDGAGNGVTNGAGIVAIGALTLNGSGPADKSTMVGYSAGNHITSGYGNICLGYNACLTTLTTGHSNFYVSNDRATIDASSSGAVNEINVLGTIVSSQTAVTVASGFGTSPSITNSTGAFMTVVNVGTGGSASSGALTFPPSPKGNGWACTVRDITNTATADTEETATTSTSVTVSNYGRMTGGLTPWTASDVLQVGPCAAY